MSHKEKENIVKEYKQHKHDQKFGYHVSARSKVNDITHICCTGTEMMLFTVRGSTDLSLEGVTFTTPGMQEFITAMMGVDHQDFLAKMEGYALQGLKVKVRRKIINNVSR
ncbi:hypothetical protein JVU11DRAFT_9215 [Chiua virens]|nr:hypothetical protein JVU11DRAFT_9215 [Chiua virens]